MRRPRPLAAAAPRPRATTAAAALVLVLGLAVVGCSGDDSTESGATDVGGTNSTPPVDGGTPATAAPTGDEDSDLGEDAPQEACPVSFTEGRAGDALPFEPADLTGSAPMWVCRYTSTSSSDAWLEWSLSAVPAKVTGEQRKLVTAFAAGLTPADPEQSCPAELGTRLLLAHEVRDGEQAHAVIDEFGCGDVRLAENLAVDSLAFAAPTWTSAPGTAKALSQLVNQE